MATVRQTLEAAWDAQENADAFMSAYGRFMVAWSDAESELYRALNAYAEVSEPVGRAIFSGVRAKQMINFIRAIAHNTQMAKDRLSDLEHVFPQIVAINEMRDFLAHHASGSGYGVDYDRPTARAFADERTSRYGNERWHWITVEMLDAMTQDLHAIGNHLNMHWGRSRTGPFRPWRENDENDPPTPWLYKSPQPANERRKNASESRKRADRQKSSRKKP